jgi:predicted HTH domain antitoxin
MNQLMTVDVVAETISAPLKPDSYDYERLPAELRDQAMLAQGTVLTKLGGAVERVIDAGNTLRWAKEALPHGEYLPWVQQACGLKATYASQLVKAAEWVNLQPAESLTGVSTTDTLFLLSADATPEDVKEWVMQRCAAGDPPTRKEVQERKRQSQGKPDRTLAQEVRAALKLSTEARELAAAAEIISSRELMDELKVDHLQKGQEHKNDSHLFLLKDPKEGKWWKLPSVQEEEPPAVEREVAGLVTLAEGAQLLGKKVNTFRVSLSPSRIKSYGNPKGNGWTAYPCPERGKCVVKKTQP